MTCTALDPLTKFRHDPYPWANKPIAFAGGPHGLQACRFSKAAPWPSISGHSKWLLETDEPVLRAVDVSDLRGVDEAGRREAQSVRLHYTRLVWADECVSSDLGWTSVFESPVDRHDYSHHNGSVVQIPDQCFTHIRRADFVRGYCVLDRHISMSVLYVDDDQPPTADIKRFRIGQGVAFGYSIQGVTVLKKVPYCMVKSRFDFTDERYCSPVGLFDRGIADGLRGKIGGVRL